MEKKYVAKYNRVFQNIITGELSGNEIILKDGESIEDYRQVPAEYNPGDQQKNHPPVATGTLFEKEGGDTKIYKQKDEGSGTV